MKRKYQNHTAVFKAKVTVEAAKGEKTTAEGSPKINVKLIINQAIDIPNKKAPIKRLTL